MTDVCECGREDGQVLTDLRRPDDLCLTRHGADLEGVLAQLDVVKARHSLQIDEHRGARQPEVHHRQQALATREKLRILSIGP